MRLSVVREFLFARLIINLRLSVVREKIGDRHLVFLRLSVVRSVAFPPHSRIYLSFSSPRQDNDEELFDQKIGVRFDDETNGRKQTYANQLHTALGGKFSSAKYLSEVVGKAYHMKRSAFSCKLLKEDSDSDNTLSKEGLSEAFFHVWPLDPMDTPKQVEYTFDLRFVPNQIRVTTAGFELKELGEDQHWKPLPDHISGDGNYLLSWEGEKKISIHVASLFVGFGISQCGFPRFGVAAPVNNRILPLLLEHIEL